MSAKWLSINAIWKKMLKTKMPLRNFFLQETLSHVLWFIKNRHHQLISRKSEFQKFQNLHYIFPLKSPKMVRLPFVSHYWFIRTFGAQNIVGHFYPKLLLRVKYLSHFLTFSTSQHAKMPYMLTFADQHTGKHLSTICNFV